MTRTTTSARSRTEAAMALLDLLRKSRERYEAYFTSSRDRSQPRTVRSGDKQFVVADQTFAIAIAGLARGHQVDRTLVAPVTVDVISHEHDFAGASSLANNPSDLAFAPVTWMPARADTVIQQHASFSDIAILCRKWMLRCVDHATHTRDWFSRYCHARSLSLPYYEACH